MTEIVELRHRLSEAQLVLTKLMNYQQLLELCEQEYELSLKQDKPHQLRVGVLLQTYMSLSNCYLDELRYSLLTFERQIDELTQALVLDGGDQ
jgi:hypothetical protein